MKKKSLTAKLQSGNWIIHNIYNTGKGKIRVDVKERFGFSISSYWIDRNYFKRNFPNLAERNCIY